mmetsp:Transcript_90948/g.266305  ORF Transcript_90948/g.266305 Transcript_90948/m.266305 type:complete len:303 (-) Transcript_90948:102-1010(-)
MYDVVGKVVLDRAMHNVANKEIESDDQLVTKACDHLEFESPTQWTLRDACLVSRLLFAHREPADVNTKVWKDHEPQLWKPTCLELGRHERPPHAVLELRLRVVDAPLDPSDLPAVHLLGLHHQALRERQAEARRRRDPLRLRPDRLRLLLLLLDPGQRGRRSRLQPAGPARRSQTRRGVGGLLHHGRGLDGLCRRRTDLPSDLGDADLLVQVPRLAEHVRDVFGDLPAGSLELLHPRADRLYLGLQGWRLVARLGRNVREREGAGGERRAREGRHHPAQGRAGRRCARHRRAVIHGRCISSS